jgi:ribonuclease III
MPVVTPPVTFGRARRWGVFRQWLRCPLTTDRFSYLPELVERVQKLLQYDFKDPVLVLEALTHSSFSNEDKKLNPTHEPISDNERLEFLGDAVIGLVVAELLMQRFRQASEGKLSRWRSYLVSRRYLAELAGQMGIGELVLLGQGEKRTGGAEKRSILAAALEALVGSVYFDGGLEAVRALLGRVFEPALQELTLHPDAPAPLLDNKTYLQEVTQSLFKTTPMYKLQEAWGPEHEKTFRVEIHVDGRFLGTGDGKSKKEAEQKAAQIALDLLTMKKTQSSEGVNENGV